MEKQNNLGTSTCLTAMQFGSWLTQLQTELAMKDVLQTMDSSIKDSTSQQE